MNHDNLQTIINNTVRHGEPRRIRLRTPDTTTTSTLKTPHYLGTQPRDVESPTVHPRPDELTDVYATLLYDDERDAVTVNPAAPLTLIRHGTTAHRDTHSIAYLQPQDNPTIALTPGQTRHAMRHRQHHLLKEGTTRIAHGNTHEHLLGVSNDDAYQRTALLNDAQHQTQNESRKPRKHATTAYQRLPFDASQN